MIVAGKEGKIYVIDRDNMGHFHAGRDLVVQSIPHAIRGGAWSMAAYFNGFIYYSGVNDTLKAFQVVNGMLRPTTSRARNISGFPGSTPSISANGTGNGIIWLLQTDAYASSGPAILRAYDPKNLMNELYDSNQNASRDQLGGAVKFTLPTIANGKVYVGTQYGFAIFGLLSAASPATATAQAAPVPPAAARSSNAELWNAIDAVHAQAVRSLAPAQFSAHASHQETIAPAVISHLASVSAPLPSLSGSYSAAPTIGTGDWTVDDMILSRGTCG
jgi:hypothetical protein